MISDPIPCVVRRGGTWRECKVYAWVAFYDADSKWFCFEDIGLRAVRRQSG
jgi:hypothetical protein